MPARTLTHLLICLSVVCLPATGQQQATSAQGSIEGRAASTDGQPLRKTNLTLRPINIAPPGGRGANGAVGSFQPPTPYATTSDAEGKFSFTGLDAGRYSLQAEHTGYITAQYGLKRTPNGIQGGNSILNLAAGQHMTGVNIELPPQATISGKVTDEDGDPMPRVQVSAMRKVYGLGTARLSPMASATSDDNGDFHLANLESGRYYISFTAVRMGALQQAVRRTGADAAVPEMGYPTLYFPGVPDIESAVQLDALEGQDKSGTNLRMRKVPVYHVRGTIGGDLPLPDPSMPQRAASGSIQVRVMPAGGLFLGGMMNMRQMSPDGTFDTGGLTPGVYTVSLVKAQGQLQTLSQTIVTVGNSDVSDLKLLAKNAVDITGAVRIVPEGATIIRPMSQAGGQQGNGQQSSQQPAPLARVAQISLDPAEGIGLGANVQPARVQADGSFTLKNVPPLKFRVFAPVPQGGYIKSAALNGQDVLANGVDMSSGGTLDIVVSMTAAQVDGTVNNADGQAVTDAMVVFAPNPAQPGRRDIYRQARSRADGGYTAPNLAPGRYRVYAFEEIEAGAFMDPDYMKPFESLGIDVTVTDSDKKTLTLTEISKSQAEDALRRAGR